MVCVRAGHASCHRSGRPNSGGFSSRPAADRGSQRSRTRTSGGRSCSSSSTATMARSGSCSTGRPSRPSARRCPQLIDLADPEDEVLVGGPVGQSAVIVLADFEDPDEAALIAFDNVGVLAGGEPTDELGAGVRRARVFAGHSGWGPGQLDGELERGDWILEPARYGDAFADDPTSCGPRCSSARAAATRWSRGCRPIRSLNYGTAMRRGLPKHGRLKIALDADRAVHGGRDRRRAAVLIAGAAVRRGAHADRRRRAGDGAARRTARGPARQGRDDLRARPRRDPQRPRQRHDDAGAGAADRLRRDQPPDHAARRASRRRCWSWRWSGSS